MSPRISERTIEEIKERSDIVEVISEYLPLKRAGVNFKTLCPFHNEKTSSFVISPVKQIFHCFGCGEGGNVFNFIMKYEKVTFAESIKILANKLGITIEEEKNDSTFNLKEVLFKINHIASDYFNNVLLNKKEGNAPLHYLYKRNISIDTIKKFKLGYAPYNLDELLSEYRNKKINFSYIEKIGLFNRGDNNSIYSRFKDRLIFPIFNYNDKISGFAGRIISDKNTAKYINSPESIIYNKSNLLYGLNFAKKTSHKKDNVIMVEGYMDVIQLHQSEIENVVATSGTALTEQHAKLIHRLTENIILSFDADSAGINAADRGIEILHEQGLYVKILVLPTGMDPDSFIQQKGKDIFLKVIDSAKDIFSFKLFLAEKKFGKKSLGGKLKIADQIIPLIIKTPNLIQQQMYIKQLSEFLNIDETTIKAEINKKLKDIKKNIPSNESHIKSDEIEVISEHEKLFLQILLQKPENLNTLLSIFSSEEITNKNISKVIEFLKSHIDENPNNIINYFQDEKITKLITELLLKPVHFDNNFEKIVEDCIKKIKLEHKKNKIKELQIDLKKAEKESDKELISKILQRITEIKKEQIKINIFS